MPDYRFHPRELAWQRFIEMNLERLDSEMAVTQADLDNLTTELTADDGAIQTEITALQAANPNLDLTGLKAAVAKTGDLVPAAAPVDSTPPAADSPASTDPTSSPASTDPASSVPTDAPPVDATPVAADPAPVDPAAPVADAA